MGDSENAIPASGELSETSKDTTRPSPSPVTATFEIVGAWVSNVNSHVSCCVVEEGATEDPSMVSV